MNLLLIYRLDIREWCSIVKICLLQLFWVPCVLENRWYCTVLALPQCKIQECQMSCMKSHTFAGSTLPIWKVIWRYGSYLQNISRSHCRVLRQGIKIWLCKVLESLYNYTNWPCSANNWCDTRKADNEVTLGNIFYL